jgi:hypothetical protein
MAVLTGNVIITGIYRHGSISLDSRENKLISTMPERIPYVPDSDAQEHVCAGPELLADIVVSAYASRYPNPLALVEAVAQYQPTPILDLMNPLPAGTVVLLPSPLFIDNVVETGSLADLAEI